MTTLSPRQIAEYAHDAGFRGKDLATAVAIALAESGGRTKAHNDLPPDDSYGLWQINMLGALGPERRRQFDLDANRDLFDPETNAEAAFEISGRGESFRPWTTFTSGRHEQFLDEARRAAKAVERDERDGRGRDRDPGRASGGRDGFIVDPDVLDDYTKRTRAIADEVGSLRGQLREVAHADRSFGKIGRETGFASALDGFGQAMRHQLDGLGKRADNLAASVTKTASLYHDKESDIAHDLLRLLRDK
jgi:Lysozyme like domain/Excreted virulence factor EspC, type VII ESX diderm